jgi:hypothetical protein
MKIGNYDCVFFVRVHLWSYGNKYLLKVKKVKNTFSPTPTHYHNYESFPSVACSIRAEEGTIDLLINHVPSTKSKVIFRSKWPFLDTITIRILKAVKLCTTRVSTTGRNVKLV